MSKTNEGLKIVSERLRCDTLISLATMDGNRLAARIVNGYYEFTV